MKKEQPLTTSETHSKEQTAEEELIIRKCQQNPEAFKPLYEKYFKRIFLFVHRRIGDKAMTADVTSQVFLKALLGLGRFQFKGLPFSAWLFRIAINECHDYFRRTNRHRMVALEDTGVEQLYEEIMTQTSLDDLHEKLPLILQRLEEGELVVIELRFFEQRPFKEVAEILGITETYAKVRTYRILEKMKNLFMHLK